MPAVVSIALAVLGVIGAIGGFLCARQLRRWERQLAGARVQVSFKGKALMTPRLLDWLTWCLSIEKDERVNGQVIYKQGGTTIALLKPRPKEHGKTKTRTIKEKAA